MADAAALVSAIGDLLWPLLFVGLVVLFRRRLVNLLEPGAEVALEFMGGKFTVKPTRRMRPAGPAREPLEGELAPVESGERLPSDYLFLNHTSFLRQDKQTEFQGKTGLPLPHYDIRVLLDSYYRGALDRVERVEYVLHESYPEPIQVRSNRAQRFLLKELANGEYVLLARVFLRGLRSPLILQRYITLWKDGPRIPS